MLEPWEMQPRRAAPVEPMDPDEPVTAFEVACAVAATVILVPTVVLSVWVYVVSGAVLF